MPNPNQYTCYVPKEWNVYPEQALRTIITEKAIDQWRHYKHIEGTTVRLENVSAKFNYYQFSPWMRKSDDGNCHPHANEYYRIKMDCILCLKACRNYSQRVCAYD